ncbi:hypothetical protein, partial [Natrialba aegyptia]
SSDTFSGNYSDLASVPSTFTPEEHGSEAHSEDLYPKTDTDPSESNLSGGEAWFRTDTGEWRGYNGTNFVTFDVTADSSS